MQNQKNPRFTQRHYESVAETIRTHKQEFLSPSVLTLALMFGKDNPRFDARRFFKACGFPDNSDDESLDAIMADYNKQMIITNKSSHNPY